MNYEDMTPEQRREYGFVPASQDWADRIKWHNKLQARREQEAWLEKRDAAIVRERVENLEAMEALQTLRATRERRAARGRAR